MTTLTSVVGSLAAGLVFATFCTTRMVPLRALAIASNIAFIGYGYLGELWPILILHAAMLPLNIHRLQQAVMLERPSHGIDRRQPGERGQRQPRSQVSSPGSGADRLCYQPSWR